MSSMQREILIAGALAVALSLLVMALRPAERVRARNLLIVVLLLASAQVINMLVAHVKVSLSADDASRVIHGWIADIVYLIVTAIVIRLVGILLFRAWLPLLRIRPPQIIEDLVVALMVIAWVGMWLRTAGMDFSSVLTTSAVLTGIVAFSMQDTLGNILGGLALQLDRSIRIGDWVRIDDLSGRVMEIRWRYTAIETRSRETVIVPNSSLMRSRFMVIGARTDTAMHWRRSVSFSLTGGGMRNLGSILEDAVLNANIAHVSADPPPSCVLMDLLPDGGRYVLRYWLTDPQFDDVTDSAVRIHCQAAILRAGIRVAIPVEEHFVTKENEAFRMARDSAEQRNRINALKQVDIFRALDDAELAELASHLVHAPFAAGDVMTRQSSVAHWLYLIVKGEADVWVQGAQGARSLVATLHDGHVFGEMGMMTGEPRRATVIAKTDVDCYRLDKEGLRRILTARPDIAAEISHVLVDREIALAQQKALVDQPEPEKRCADILARIREFFAMDVDTPTT